MVTLVALLVLASPGALEPDLPPADAPNVEAAPPPADVPRADEPLPLAPPRPRPTELPRGRSFVVPAIEALFVDFALASFNNLVSREPFAQISLDSIHVNLPLSAWELDSDYFLTNQFGHPYQGALAFTAARSAGLSFWWSTLYPFVTSLAWELFFEVDKPSVNDHITTTVGGALLGEALFRLSMLVVRSGLPKWAREVFSFLLAPPAWVNDALFDEQFAAGDLPRVPFYRGWLGGGIVVQSQAARLGAFITARVIHGSPYEEVGAPFSHFDIAADLSIDRTQVVGDFTVRGLLWGRAYRLGLLRGVAGLFGSYEYVAPRLFRASSVNLGGGSLGALALTAQTSLELTAIVSAIPFGAGGVVAPSEVVGSRDYHVGPGVHLEGEVSLTNERFGFVSLGVRRWNLFGGFYTQPAGHDAITYAHLNAFVRVGREAVAGLELVRALRDTRSDGVDLNQALTQIRLVVCWLFSGELGIVAHR